MFQFLASMLPDRTVESFYKTHVSGSPCWLSSLYTVKSDYPHPYWLWPGVQGGSSWHHVFSSPSQLWPPIPSKGSAFSQWMPEAQIVTVLLPQLLLWCLVPLVSHTSYPILHFLMPGNELWFFFLIHWHQILFLLSWVYYECRGFSQTQIWGAGPLKQNL